MNLVNNGKIIEIDSQKYYENTDRQETKPFSNFSKDIYKKAIEKYNSH